MKTVINNICCVFLYLAFLNPLSCLSQKVDQCELLQHTSTSDAVISNDMLEVSYHFGESFGTVATEAFNRLVSASSIDVTKSKIDEFVAIDYSEERRHALVFYLEESTDENVKARFALVVSKNFYTGVLEESVLEKFIENLNRLKLYTIIKSESGSHVHTYKDKDGLWWYYVKYVNINLTDRPSYLVLKNYSDHLLMQFYFSELEEAQDINQHIENISIDAWHDDIKLKKSKKPCH